MLFELWKAKRDIKTTHTGCTFSQNTWTFGGLQLRLDAAGVSALPLLVR
jgi:hypothetical protein